MKPYDKNRSFLNKVKNAVKGYFTPSWMQSTFSPAKNSGETSQNGCISGISGPSNPDSGYVYNERNMYKKRIHSNDFSTKDKLGECRLTLEPPSKRRALEKNVEFVEDHTLLLGNSTVSCSSSTSTCRPSLFLNKTPSPALNQSLTSVLKCSPRNSMLFSSDHPTIPEASSLMSPFYNGPITYGGANAHQHRTQKSLDDPEDQLLISKKQSNLGLSKTTQKILNVLEKSPLQKMNLPSLNSDQEKQRSLMAEVFNRERKSTHGPPVKQMLAPIKVNIKPNYALLNSKPSNVDEGSSLWTGKIRREREKLHNCKRQDEESTKASNQCDGTDLSHIKLPLVKMTPLLCSTHDNTCSNDFKFSLPQTAHGRRCFAEDVKLLDMSFVFSKPECKGKASAPETSATTNPILNSLTSFNVDVDAAMKKPLATNDECVGIRPAKALKTGSVLDVLSKDLPILNAGGAKICPSRPEAVSLKEQFKSSADVWSCPTCMVSCKIDLSLCPCCSTPKPSADTSIVMLTSPSLSSASSAFVVFTSSDSSLSLSLSKASEKGPLPSLSSMFAAKPGEWTCALCMIKNGNEAAKCVACDAFKSGSSNIQSSEMTPLVARVEEPSLEKQDFNARSPVKSSELEQAPSLSTMFAAKPGEWDCNVCMVRNKSENTECVSCEASRHGTEALMSRARADCISSSSPKLFKINADSGGFSFGLVPPFKFSEFGNKCADGVSAKQEPNVMSGGFKPSFRLCYDALPSSNVGFTGFGGGFHFAPTTSHSASAMPVITTSSIANVPSLAESSTIIQSSDRPIPLNILPSERTNSNDTNINNCNSLFSNVDSKPLSNISFGIIKEVKSGETSSFPFGFNFSSQNAYGSSIKHASKGGGATSINNSRSGLSPNTQDTFKFGSSSGIQSSANVPLGLPPSNQTGNIFMENTSTASDSLFAFSTSSSSALFPNTQKNHISPFHQSQMGTNIVPNASSDASSFSFNGAVNSGVFGGRANAVFDFAGARPSSNGDDTVMESPQPVLSSFGGSKADYGFNFGKDSSSNPGMGNGPTSQGFTFSSVPPVPSFNFAQSPSFVGQQAPQQPAGNLQFNFGSANLGTGNFTFSAGGSHGRRIIKKGARRITKK